MPLMLQSFFMPKPLFFFLIYIKVISHGMAVRTQGTSGVNPLSSRSHAMLQIQLKHPNQQMVGRWDVYFFFVALKHRDPNAAKL